jgi:hypothetical protein
MTASTTYIWPLKFPILNYFWGGESTIDGTFQTGLQRDSRAGATLAVPFARRYAVKMGYSAGVVSKSGGDFNSFLISLQALL